ncbi:hypothetical protein TWF102_000522 [Orbilia oligospora]|uniref:Uncharacterized protein n=1 Tax=Orbilia oligospora TaxID=2813651 RepID=A0A7C8J1W9_ORBOL|nr:hypothetical protein TWF102_000522 [Orbilia oligospora]KAF3097460.1 hypothetical protein TWF706_007319 [Orbilia oligospora]KAF3104333.1 hypothetical protein TWF103_006991 [Orbilia oligospora]
MGSYSNRAKVIAIANLNFPHPLGSLFRANTVVVTLQTPSASLSVTVRTPKWLVAIPHITTHFFQKESLLEFCLPYLFPTFIFFDDLSEVFVITSFAESEANVLANEFSSCPCALFRQVPRSRQALGIALIRAYI